MDPKMVDFIANWEVESYRSKVALNYAPKKFAGKIAIVTGGAKGFGKEIALSLAKDGATTVIADRDILNGVREQATIPYDMKWNPDCEDCLPEGINDCIECHKRQEGR